MPNARRELLLEAGARHERMLEAVSSTPLLGGTGPTRLQARENPRTQAGNPEAGLGDYAHHVAPNLRCQALASMGARRSIAVIASWI
jgi:hypothetical protein